MKKKIIIGSSSLLIIFFLLLVLINYYNERVILNINGESNLVLSLNDKYKELGATAKVCSFNKCNNITEKIHIKDNIDTDVVGKYKVVYEVKHNKKVYVKERKVVVVDDVSPLITLSGSKSVQICPNAEYDEEGYSAFDNYDGDITDDIVIEKNRDSILYNVKDSSSNNTVVIRKIERIDDTKPIIKIKGSSIINLKLNDQYQEYGVTVSDNCDTISNKDVVISSNVDTTKVGTYNVRYTVKDSSGNVGTANRTVKVTKPVVFNTVKKEDYLDSLESYIKSKNYNVSIGYVNLNTGYSYLYNDKVVYYGASLVKTVGALYVYEKMDFNESTRQKVEKAISVSDNTAHRQIVDLIGIENLRVYGRNIGANNFLTRSNKDYFGNTTVKDQIEIWKYLYNFINTNSKGKELKQYFINDYCNYLLFDGIPTTMHKYGYYGTYFHDVGIIYSDNPYLVVILTKHGNGNFKSVVKDLSKKMYDFNKIDN